MRAGALVLVFAVLAVPSAGRASPSDPSCRVKAIVHTGRTGKCFYYSPDSEGYARIDMDKPGRRWFCTEAEAEVAGCHDPDAD